ncbi:MAG: hypothetical protein JWN31_1352 [Frankiales bacterium]|nr:hypothetical protein [Frankiales bacterium]
MTAAVLAALAGAALFGLASALQHQEAAAVDTSARPSLLLTLARRPLWLIGMAVDVGAVALQGLALRLGSVSLVQTLLVAGLPLATALSALLARRRLRRPEVIGLVLCSVGLALLGPQLASSPQGHPPSRQAALVVGAAISALAGPLLLLRHHPRFGGAAAGAAAGLVVGASAVLLSVTAARVGDWSHLFGSWAVYATAAVGLVGLLLTQVSFQTGDLGAPLAALSLVEPITAVVIAINVLDERAPSVTVTAVLGTVCAAAGVLVLARD